MIVRIAMLALICLSLTLPARAVDPDEVLADPKLEERAREISGHLRCLVCQNQSIDSSDAPLAKDLRVLVRERLSEGDTNSEVLDYVVDRYGEFVLLRPKFAVHTLLLWGAPLVALIGGIWVFVNRHRQRNAIDETSALSEAEKSELTKILGEREG